MTLLSAEKKKFVSLIRVSTKIQAQSNLGLESQKYSVEKYVESAGGEIIESIIEVESAGNRDKISIDSNLNIDKLLRKRPKLLYAIRLAQKEKATIVVKEASRLSRFSLLIDFLLSSGVDFVCSDSPNDSPLILKLKTSINEEELVKISSRTRSALQAKKARGEVLKGCPANLNNDARLKASRLRKERAFQDPNYKVMGYIVMCRDKGNMLFREICERLNNENHKTTTGKLFVVGIVIWLYNKAKQLESESLKVA